MRIDTPGRSGTITSMAGPPDSTKTSLQQRLSARARQRWPQLVRIQIRFCGTFAYVTGTTVDDQELPLMRLRYGGSASTWGFRGLPGQQRRIPGLRTAQRLHRRGSRRCPGHRLRPPLYLGDPLPGHEPPTDLRPSPLSDGAAAASSAVSRVGATVRIGSVRATTQWR